MNKVVQQLILIILPYSVKISFNVSHGFGCWRFSWCDWR